MPERELPLLFEDAHLVAVDKPSGMVVHRGWARDKITLVDVLAEQLGRRIHPVHRLDRGTSGVILFAYESEAIATLKRAFEAREGDPAVDKTYLALVRGHPPESGTVDHPIQTKAKKQGPRVDARTDFERLWTWERPRTDLPYPRRYALVRAQPRTGRLHQIRRHLAHISHPLIGDVNYGKGEHNRWFREHYALHRLALHALRLSFPHPISGVPMSIATPVPEDLAGPLRELGVPRALLEP